MFLRILKQKNRSGLAYKIAVVKSFRKSEKVRHEILLYVGTFSEKYRHDVKRHKKFIETMTRKFAQADFKPYEKTNFKQKVYDLFPEMYQTMLSERDIAQRRRK